MSVRALNWAYDAKIENTTYKFVLCVLANYANDEDEAWPYIETLAETVSCGRRTVERALAALEEDGWITRRPGYMVGTPGWRPSPDELRVPAPHPGGVGRSPHWSAIRGQGRNP